MYMYIRLAKFPSFTSMHAELLEPAKEHDKDEDELSLGAPSA